jgi:hypothetical protein
MPYTPRVGKTLLRAVGASLTSILIFLAANHWIGVPGSSTLAAIYASSIMLLCSLLIIPWMLPEIKELLNI